jgi:magnesium transporter
MKLRLRRPRDLALAIRDLARRRPREAEEYLETHEEEWSSLAEADPHDAADILEAIDEEAAAELISDLSPTEAADVLEEMQDEAAADLLEELHPAEAAGMIAELEAHEAADIVEHLDAEARTAIFDELSDRHVDDILDLLRYPPDSAGGLMSSGPATIPLGLTAGAAIEELRRLHARVHNLNYVYVVDADSRLVGVVSFRDLVFATPEAPLNEAMVASPLAVRPEVDREEVAAIFQRYGLLALPVVDHRGVLLGLIDVDDVIEAVQREATEDIAAMVGAGIEETIFTPVATSIRHRLPWLVVNLATALMVTVTISRFEPLIGRLTVLAAYMPVVASMGGNGGAQSQAVVIRTLAAHGVPSRIVGRVIGREVMVGLWNGLAIGLISGAIAGSFTGEPRIGLVLGMAALVNLVIANLAGTGIPLLLHRLGKDPALGSNILMTTITDLFGFGGFLAIAALFL